MIKNYFEDEYLWVSWPYGLDPRDLDLLDFNDHIVEDFEPTFVNDFIL